MSLRKIHITKQDQGIGQIGGGAWVEDMEHWPMDQLGGRPMVPLWSITPVFFPVPQIAENVRITVFVPATDEPRSWHEASEQLLVRSGKLNPQSTRLHAKVLLHPQAAQPYIPNGVDVLPEGYLGLEPMTDEELNLETRHLFKGAAMSKQLGREHWLQEQVVVSPRYFFAGQLLEADLVKWDAAYTGIFGGGIGYLFLDYRIKQVTDYADAGIFFIQYAESK